MFSFRLGREKKTLVVEVKLFGICSPGCWVDSMTFEEGEERGTPGAFPAFMVRKPFEKRFTRTSTAKPIRAENSNPSISTGSLALLCGSDHRSDEAESFHRKALVVSLRVPRAAMQNRPLERDLVVRDDNRLWLYSISEPRTRCYGCKIERERERERRHTGWRSMRKSRNEE